MIRAVLGIAAAALLFVLYRAESSALAEVRLEGGNVDAQRERFRRRSLGILLIAALVGGVLIEPEVVAPLGLRGRGVYYGSLGMLVVLLMLVVVRDFKAIARQTTEEYQQTTLRALTDLEEHLRRAREQRENEAPSPNPDPGEKEPPA